MQGIWFGPQYKTLRHTYMASGLGLNVEHLDTHTWHQVWSSIQNT